MILATLGSALVPSLLLLWYFHSRDLHREPQRVLWATFGLGMLSVVPVLLLALPVQLLLQGVHAPELVGLAQAFLVAAVPEELLKMLVLLLYCARHREFDEPMDGVVYGVTASLGFATLENVIYVAGGGLPVAITRAVTAVPGHAFTGAIMGYYVGRARFEPGPRRGLLLRAYAVPVLLHGLYDWPLLTVQAMGVGEGAIGSREALVVALCGLAALAVLVVELIWALRVAWRLARAQLLPVIVAPAPLAVPVPEASVPLARLAPPGAAPDPVPPARAPVAPAARHPVAGWILAVGGAALAALGLLIGLLLVMTLAVSEVDVEAFLIGTCVVSGGPVVLGVLLFGLGAHFLSRPRRCP